MRVLIVGKTGQVGRELGRAQWPAGTALSQLTRADCDLADPRASYRAVLQLRPDVVVNAAAYTAVDRAESEPVLAGTINCDAPATMAEACHEIGASLIHLSTDYVFDGSAPDASSEDDPIAPLSVYGRTKAEGEAAVRNVLASHVIVRTSWVFAAHGSNFVRTILRLAREQPELRIVCDQRGAPTAARDIAGALVSIADSIARGRAGWGTFHFTSAQPTTWCEFARTIIRLSGLPAKVIPIATADYKTAARRPPNSVLDCRRIALEYGITQPSWRRALAEVLSEMNEASNINTDTQA